MNLDLDPPYPEFPGSRGACSMNIRYLGAAVAVAALAVAAPASAEVYGALNAGALSIKLDSPLDDANVVTLGARLGWKANKWVGVEGDLFFGVKEDRVFDTPPV